jgi:molecular chaperone HscB
MTDHFERLGLPRRFSLDPAVLEAAYLERSRAVHPDFHHGASGGEQAASETLTAAVNEAYAALKDPFRRADHLLALLGGPTATEVKDLPPAFLMEMMDLREEIERAPRGRRSTRRTRRSGWRPRSPGWCRCSTAMTSPPSGRS